MSDSPLDTARHDLNKAADAVVRWGDATLETGRRIVGLPTEMDGHRERLDVRLREIDGLKPAATLDGSERHFFSAYQRDAAGKLIGESAFLSNEGHGAGLFVTLTDRALDHLREGHPLAGKGADWVMDKVDWDQIKTVFDPAHAQNATNWQGICASVAVAAEIAPLAKPEELAEKFAAGAERKLAQALEHEAAEHPQRFLHEAEKALEWADHHLPEGAKKAFDKALDKLTDYAKEHGKAEAGKSEHGEGSKNATLIDGDRAQMAKMGEYHGPATHTGKVVVVDADVVVQRVGDAYVRYNLSDLGGHVPKPGSIDTLGNGVAVPVLPKIERAIAALDASGANAPALSDLRQREPGKSYTGELHHLEGDTYFLSAGRGTYVVLDAKADLHGQHPPVDQVVTIGPSGAIGTPALEPHAQAR